MTQEPRTSAPSDNLKRRIVFASVAFAAADGILIGLVPNTYLGDLVVNAVTAIGAAILILVWCSADSNERGHAIGAGLRILIILLGPFALWLYMARTRRPKQALVAIGQSLALVIALAVLSDVIAVGVASVYASFT